MLSSYIYRNQLIKLKTMRVKLLEDLNRDFSTCISFLEHDTNSVRRTRNRETFTRLSSRGIMLFITLLIILNILIKLPEKTKENPLTIVFMASAFSFMLLFITCLEAKYNSIRNRNLHALGLTTAWPDENDAAFINILKFLDHTPDTINAVRRWRKDLPDIDTFKSLKNKIQQEIKCREQCQSAILFGIFGYRDKFSSSPLGILQKSPIAEKNIIKLIFDHAGLREKIAEITLEEQEIYSVNPKKNL